MFVWSHVWDTIGKCFSLHRFSVFVDVFSWVITSCGLHFGGLPFGGSSFGGLPFGGSSFGG